MKVYRIIVIVLLCLVGGLSYLLVSNRGKSASAGPQTLWQTNTVERWHTNTVESWHTNTVAAAPTNVPTQYVTNVVTRDVPMPLSPLEKQAATVGYKLLNAPKIDNPTEALFKAAPLSVDVEMDERVSKLLSQDASSVRKYVDQALTGRGIAVAENSPYHLNLRLMALWSTDVPRVALLGSTLQVRQTVAVQRGDALLQCPASLWSAGNSRLFRMRNVPAELDTELQQLLDKFCDDYQKTRDNEKTVESRLPTIPSDFLTGGK